MTFTDFYRSITGRDPDASMVDLADRMLATDAVNLVYPRDERRRNPFLSALLEASEVRAAERGESCRCPGCGLVVFGHLSGPSAPALDDDGGWWHDGCLVEVA